MRDAYIYAAGPNPRHYTYRSHLPCEFSQVSGHVGGPITSRLLAVPGTRPPAISTRKRAFDSCSTSFLVAVLILAKRGSLYCGFCPPPLCLFNKLERPNEMMKIALIFRTTAGLSSYSSAGFLLPPWFFISGFSAAWKGCEGCWTNSKRSWSKIDSVSVFWYRYRRGESLRSIRVW